MKFKHALILSFLLLIQIRCNADVSSSAMGQAILSDGKNLLLSPLRMNQEDIKFVMGITAIIGGVAIFDESIQRHLYPDRNKKSSVDLRHFGDAGQLAGPAIGTVFAIQGIISDDEKSKETALLSYESFVFAGLTEATMKFVVGRSRPSKTDDAFIFKTASGDGAFPSGHTTEAFAAATVFAEQYPSWWVIIPSYAAASVVGFSRLAVNQHWASDVVAAAVLGTAVSHYLRKWHLQAKNSSQSLQISPNGVKWVKAF